MNGHNSSADPNCVRPVQTQSQPHLKGPEMLTLEEMTATVPRNPHPREAQSSPEMKQALWVPRGHLLTSQGVATVSVALMYLSVLLMITVFYSCTKTTSTVS